MSEFLKGWMRKFMKDPEKKIQERIDRDQQYGSKRLTEALESVDVENDLKVLEKYRRNVEYYIAFAQQYPRIPNPVLAYAIDTITPEAVKKFLVRFGNDDVEFAKKVALELKRLGLPLAEDTSVVEWFSATHNETALQRFKKGA